MYLVTVENQHGIWCEDPEGFDTSQEAETYATAKIEEFPKSRNWGVLVYNCSLHKIFGGDDVGEVKQP